jgi:hypothetical protein
MTRFGQQHRDQQRRQARAQAGKGVQALYEKPAKGCVESKLVYEQEDPDFRIVQRLVTHDEKLVEFAVVLIRLQKGQWVEVYSVDTVHGTLHEHISGHNRENDSREIQPMYTQVDVQESLDEPAMRLVQEMYRRVRS